MTADWRRVIFPALLPVRAAARRRILAHRQGVPINRSADSARRRRVGRTDGLAVPMIAPALSAP